MTYTKKPRGRGPMDDVILPPHHVDPLVAGYASGLWPGWIPRPETQEIRTVSSTGGEKGVKPQRYSLLPVEALAAIAEHYGKGAAKYSDHNWRRGYEWSKSYDALQRHLNAFWMGEDFDDETGSLHLAAAGFHVLALLQWSLEGRFDHDDRYKA